MSKPKLLQRLSRGRCLLHSCHLLSVHFKWSSAAAWWWGRPARVTATKHKQLSFPRLLPCFAMRSIQCHAWSGAELVAAYESIYGKDISNDVS